ncbi:hypothetical protein ACO0RG_002211 [Hanseniaspora osmophila]
MALLPTTITLLKREKCVGSKEKCQKPTASHFNTQVVCATVIPVVVVIIILAIITTVLWRKHKREKLDDNDPDFNGETEFLPEIQENPFHTNYNDKTEYTHGSSPEYKNENSENENDDFDMDDKQENNFYSNLKPPQTRNTTRNFTGASSGSVNQNDISSTHSAGTRHTSATNMSHLNVSGMSGDPFQLPVLSSDNNHRSVEDLRSYVKSFDLGAYTYKPHASIGPLNSGKTSTTNHNSFITQKSLIDNSAPNPMAPMFQKNPYNHSKDSLHNSINILKTRAANTRSPLNPSFAPSTSSGINTQENVIEAIPNKNENEKEQSKDSAQESNEKQLSKEMAGVNLTGANANDEDNDYVSGNGSEEENIRRLKSIYKVYLDRRSVSTPGYGDQLSPSKSETPTTDSIAGNNKHSSVYTSHIKDISNIISEDENENEESEAEMNNDVIEEEEEEEEEEDVTDPQELGAQKQDTQEISFGNIKPTTSNSTVTHKATNDDETDNANVTPSTNATSSSDMEDISKADKSFAKPKPNGKAPRHTSSIYSERATMFNLNDKSYASHELPQMDLSAYQDQPSSNNSNITSAFVEPQALKDLYQFDNTSQQYYYYDPSSQYHYYYDPQTGNYYFYEPTTQQYYYVDPQTHQQYFYDIQKHQPYYYDTQQNQYFYLSSPSLQQQQQQMPNMNTIPEESLNDQFMPMQPPNLQNLPYHHMHPQTKENLEELPTPSTLTHSDSIHSLTSFKPQSRTGTMTNTNNPFNKAFNPIDNPEISFYSSNAGSTTPMNNYPNTMAESYEDGSKLGPGSKVLPHHLRNSIVMTNPMELSQTMKTYKPAGSFRKNQMFQQQQMFGNQYGADPRVSTLIDDMDMQVPVKLTGNLLPHRMGSKDDLRRQLRE